jgi:hypothetical protein
MRTRVTLVIVVYVTMRIEMKDCQPGVTATYCPHYWMSNGMVAPEANQWMAWLHCARHILLDDIPWITGPIELYVSMIFESAGDAEIDAGFTPGSVRVTA